MIEKRAVIINDKRYAVGYPQCRGCENFCAGGICLFPGPGCEYPDDEKVLANEITSPVCPECGGTNIEEVSNATMRNKVTSWSGGFPLDYGTWTVDHEGAQFRCYLCAQCEIELEIVDGNLKRLE
jgi:hypothetical protein